MNRTRLEQVKGEHQDCSTQGELARLLGVHPQTIKRWRREERIPQPDVRGTNGWFMWSPDLVRRIIQERTNRGGK